MSHTKTLIRIRNNILADMRTQGHINPTAWDINNGWCEEFAMAAIDAIPGADMEDLYDEYDLAHYAVVIDGRYYDAEAITGVDNPHELPIARFNLRPNTH